MAKSIRFKRSLIAMLVACILKRLILRYIYEKNDSAVKYFGKSSWMFDAAIGRTQ